METLTRKSYGDTVEEIKVDEETKRMLESITSGETKKVTLADAIRGGSKFTDQASGWGDGVKNACALTAAAQYAEALGYI